MTRSAQSRPLAAPVGAAHRKLIAAFSQSLTLRVLAISMLTGAAIAVCGTLLIGALNKARLDRFGEYVAQTFEASCAEVISAYGEQLVGLLDVIRDKLEHDPTLIDLTGSASVSSLKFRKGTLSISLHDSTGRELRTLLSPQGATSAGGAFASALPTLTRGSAIAGVFGDSTLLALGSTMAVVAGLPAGPDRFLFGALDLRAVAQQIESLYAGRVVILSGDGRPLIPAGGDMSQRIIDQLSIGPSYQIISVDGVTYEAIRATLHDLSGRRVGAINLIRPDDGEIAAEQLLNTLISIVGLSAFLLISAALYVGLRGELSPLREVDRLVQSLSAADLNAPAVTTRRDDEVGRIARSVEALRAAAIEHDQVSFAVAAAHSRERSLIESELRRLSAMLAPSERDEILLTLAKVREHNRPADPLNSPAADSALAVAFRFMSDRVRAQQDRLSTLLAERTADLETVRQALVERTDLFRLREELSVARDLQLSMQPDPKKLVAIRDTVELEALTRPAKEVGGDSYDFQLLDSGKRLMFLVCDSSGKGVPAAMFVLTSKSLACAASEAYGRLDRGLETANSALARTNESMSFTTMFIGLLDLETGHLRYSNAGHNPPIVRRASGELIQLNEGKGLVLGVFEDARYDEAELKLQPGDTLILYTDGITEAHNSQSAMYGIERFEASCAAAGQKAPSDLIQHLLADVDTYTGEAPQYDDITLMVFRYRAHG